MAPAEFADDEVAAVGKSVADFYGMVAALYIVFPILLIFGHDGRRVRGIGPVRH